MTYLSKSKLVLVLTAVLGTAGALAAAPTQSGIQQLGSNRALQSATPPNKVVIPVAPPNPIPINTLPFQVTTPGYYQLTKDLTGNPNDNGIRVVTDDVFIDLNGFGINQGLTGILCSGKRTTIFNGSVFGFSQDGIFGPECTVIGVQVFANTGHGMDLGPGSIVQDCTVPNNDGDGIRGSDLRIVQCRVFNNKQNGISGLDGGLFVSQCDVASNVGFGIRAPESNPAQLGENMCAIEDCRINGNGFGGVQLPSFAQVRRCFVSDNVANGIHVGQFSYVGHCSALRNNTGILTSIGSRVEGCIVSSSADGISVSDGTSVEDCETFDNITGIFCTGGVSVRNSVSNRNKTGIVQLGEGLIEGCTVKDNELAGISVKSDAVVANNRVLQNQGQGILATEDANRIEGNHVTRNGVGIEVLGPRNLIVRNSLDMNGVQMQIAADNVQGPFLKTKGFIDNANPWANFDLSFPTTFP